MFALNLKVLNLRIRGLFLCKDMRTHILTKASTTTLDQTHTSKDTQTQQQQQGYLQANDL